MQSRKSLLFSDDKPLVKKDDKDDFYEPICC